MEGCPRIIQSSVAFFGTFGNAGIQKKFKNEDEVNLTISLKM
jgi:hypothetical protein